jgi:uncharacterized protein (TIGR00304 family)
MRIPRAAAWGVIAIAIVLILAAIIIGELKVAIFIVFPVLYGMGLMAAAAILLLFVGIIMLFASAAPPNPYGKEEGTTNAEPDPYDDREGKKTKFGGVVLIGPIPIIFGTDRRTALLAMVIMAIVLMALALLLLTWPFGQG